MRALLAVVAASVVFAATRSEACKCATGTPFLDAALSEPVAIVRVTTPGRQAVEVTVERMLSTGAKLPATLKVLGADGGNCNASVAGFAKGARLVMALAPSPRGFDLKGCGVYWLALDGTEVTGAIAPGVERLSVKAFEARLQAAQASYRQFTGP